jgi:PhnB protein
MEVASYLVFNGQCEDAFRFYEQCFGGKIELMLNHEGAPTENEIPAEWRKKIMHARLKVGDGVLMGSDASSQHYERPQGFSVQLAMNDRAEADRIFRALAENGKVCMPIQKTFWADRFGMVVDQFGTPWMINCYGGCQ